MGFSWGGFSQGLNQGLQTAEKIGGAIDDYQIARLRAKGMQEAKEAQAKAAAQVEHANAVQDNGGQGLAQSAAAGPRQAPVETFAIDVPGQTPVEAPAARYNVAGRSFLDEGEAKTHSAKATARAKKNAPSDIDFFVKTAVPQIAAKYIEQGRPDLADAWGKWAGEKTSQKHMETWAKAKRASMTGDIEGAADHVMELYRGYDDGVTPLGKEVVKDKSGQVTGFNVRLKDDDTGEERVQFVGPQELDSGLGMLAPTELFKKTQEKVAAAEAARAKSAMQAADDARDLVKTVKTEEVKAGFKVKADASKSKEEVALQELKGRQELEQIAARAKAEEDGLGKKEKAAFMARKEVLRAEGFSDDEIREFTPALLKVDGYKKETSPEERRAMIATEMSKDPSFVRATPEKQKEKVDQIMRLATPTPKAAAPRPAPPKAKGFLIYDPDNDKMFSK